MPIIKKATLNPNMAENYRPITLSSVHTKLIERIMLPEDNISDNQFGFRQGRGTAFGCSLLNDVIQYSIDGGSTIYVCSLDAEKCFDKIWHEALLYKLWNKIPLCHWMFIYRWYKSLHAVVRWNEGFSDSFNITRGTRQGSVLSPIFFNYFIDDLLQALVNAGKGLKVGECGINNFAYADDITLLSSTITGLQSLIDLCHSYASEWRFSFGLKKSKCMTVGRKLFSEQPKWYIGGHLMSNTINLEILGVSYDATGSNHTHVGARSSACRRSFFGLADVGMSYPGFSSEVKSHLWKSVCAPTLLYGVDGINMNDTVIKQVESIQGSLMKQCLGRGKRCNHANGF